MIWVFFEVSVEQGISADWFVIVGAVISNEDLTDDTA